jgi:hypothetical protein
MYLAANLTSDVPMSVQLVTKAVAPKAASPPVPHAAPSTYKSELPTIPISRVFVVPALKAVDYKNFYIY